MGVLPELCLYPSDRDGSSPLNGGSFALHIRGGGFGVRWPDDMPAPYVVSSRVVMELMVIVGLAYEGNEMKAPSAGDEIIMVTRPPSRM